MIYIEVLNRYWNPGTAYFDKKDKQGLQDFHEYLAEEYSKLIVRAIDDQRYKNKWANLTASHLNYKRKHGHSLKTWEMTGELKNALSVKKRRSLYVVGYPNKFHSGTKIKYKDLAKVLEFGSITIPPRPLFRNAHRYMSSNIKFFYSKYLKLSEKEGGR